MTFAPLVIKDVPGDDDVRQLVAQTDQQQVIAKVNLEDLSDTIIECDIAEWKHRTAKDVLWEAAYYGILLHPETVLDKLGELINEAATWN